MEQDDRVTQCPACQSDNTFLEIKWKKLYLYCEDCLTGTVVAEEPRDGQ